MYLLHRSPHLVSLGSLSAGGDLRPSLAPFSATAPSATWTRVECRDSQVPGKSIPCLCHALRFRPVRTDLALPVGTMLSPQFRQRGHPQYPFRNSIPWLRHPLSTLQVVRYRTRMQDWLPAGGWPLPGGSRTLWTSAKGFYPLHRTFSFPRLILARRKVGFMLLEPCKRSMHREPLYSR